MTAGRDRAGDEETASDPKKSRAWYARAGSEAGRETKRYLKYSQQRREMAKYLGVDPNSTNPILNEMLDALAWAAVGGNFSAGEALGAVTGTAAAVISNSGKVNQFVLEQEPEQLRETIHARLLKFCSDDDSIRSFLRRGAFSDTLRVELTGSIEKLGATESCNDLIETGRNDARGGRSALPDRRAATGPPPRSGQGRRQVARGRRCARLAQRGRRDRAPAAGRLPDLESRYR
jgi:hypothetical protein